MSTALRMKDGTQEQAPGAVPPFEPHAWLRGGHAQTIAGRYLGSAGLSLAATRHEVPLGDGDRLCVLETTPERWRPGAPAAVLVHGLAGCARAPYVVRVSRRLLELGVRVLRMNLRGAGEGFGLARGIYHAGRSDDLRRAVEWLAARAPGSPIALVGFSLGASLTLKLAAEAADRPVNGLDCVLAANPPLDLSACARSMRRLENRIYDWNFVRWLRAEVVRLHRHFPDLERPDLRGVQSVFDFDDRYTAPRNGFRSADDYYERSSAGPLVSRIVHRGLVVHAEDDPFIPPGPFQKAAFPRQLDAELSRHGGHLGYLSRSPWRGNRRWLDARLVEWLAIRWDLSAPHPSHVLFSPATVESNLGVHRHV
jgi:predicted alpha/beta-fold hydrolase